MGRWLLLCIVLLVCPYAPQAQMIQPSPPWRIDPAHPLFQGLVSWWAMMPGRTGGTRIWDMARHNHCTTGGNAAYAIDNSTVRGGGVLTFDGTGDYADCGNPSALQFERTSSFSLVVNFRAVTGACLVCKARNSGAFTGYWLQFNAGSLWAVFVDASINAFSRATTPTYNDGLWHQAISTYAGTSTVSGVNLYIDGAAPATTTPQTDTLSNTMISSDPLYIGNVAVDINSGHTGDIGLVAIYNRVLSAAEIAQWATCKAPEYCGLVIDTTPPYVVRAKVRGGVQ